MTVEGSKLVRRASELARRSRFEHSCTPEALWPERWRGRTDPVREFWLKNPRLVATEILTATDAAAIIATRR